MWSMIATWRMALDGVIQGSELLEKGCDAGSALECAICDVEDNPYFKSVGYGGLPNEDGVVELDAAFMNGDTLGIGAVCAIQDYANPIRIARQLSREEVNCVLCGAGANRYAEQNGFQNKTMLTQRAEILYHNRMLELNAGLSPYQGHDTVGMVALDIHNTICTGTSTSGLFMKKKGRLGDSAIVGSGFYADSRIGGASATGLGEDLMKGCISYEIVSLMRAGMHP